MYARTSVAWAGSSQAMQRDEATGRSAAPLPSSSDDAALLAEESMRAWAATYGATGTGTGTGTVAVAAAQSSSRGSTAPRATARSGGSGTTTAAVDIYAQHNAWYRGGGGAATPGASGSLSARPSRPSSGTRTQPRRPLDPATHAATTALSLGLSAATGLALLHSSPVHMGVSSGAHTARPASRQNYQSQQSQAPHPDRAWLLNQGLLGSLNGRSHTTAAAGDAHTTLPRIAHADAAASSDGAVVEEEQEQEEKTAAGSGSARSRAGSTGLSRPSRRSSRGDGTSPDLALRALLLNQAVLGSGAYFSFTPQPRVAVPAEPLSGAVGTGRSRSRPGSSGLDTRMRPNHAGTPSTRVVPPFKPAFTIAAPPPPPHPSSSSDGAGAQRSYVNYAQLMMRTHSRASSAATPTPTTPVARVRTPLSQQAQQQQQRNPSATARSYRPGSSLGLGLKLSDVVDDRASSSSAPGSGLVSRASRASLRDPTSGTDSGPGAGDASGPELFDEESLVGAEVMRLAAAPESELLAQILATQRDDEAAALEAHFSGDGAAIEDHHAGGRASFDRAASLRMRTTAAAARTSSMPIPAPLTTEEALADQAAHIRELEAQFANLHRQQPNVREGGGASTRSKSRRSTMAKTMPPVTVAATAATAAPAASALAPNAQGGLMSPGQRAHFVAQRRALDEAEEKDLERQRASAASNSAVSAASASAATPAPQAHVRFVDEPEALSSQSRRPAREVLSGEQQRALHQRWAALDAAHKVGGGGSGDGGAGPDPLAKEVAAVLARVDSITTVQALWRGRRARAHVQRRRARLKAMEEAERRAAEEQALFDQITAQQQQEQQQQQQDQQQLGVNTDVDPAASASHALDPWEEPEAPDPEVQLALLQAAQKQARLVAQFDSAMAATVTQLDATNPATLAQQQPHPPKTGAGAALPRRQSRGRKMRQSQATSSVSGSAGPSSSCATPTPVPAVDPALSHAALLRLQLKQSLQAEAEMIREMLLENAAKARIHAQHSAAQRAHRSALAHRALLSTMSMGPSGSVGVGSASGSGPPGSLGGAPRVPGGGGGGGAGGGRRRDLYGTTSPSLDENGSDMGGEDPTDELLYGQLSGLGVGSAATGAASGNTRALDSFGLELASNGGGETRHRGGGRGHYHSTSMSSVSEDSGGGDAGGAGEGGLFGPGLALVGLGGESHAYRTQLRNAGLLIEGAGSGASAADATGAGTGAVSAASSASQPKHPGLGATAGGVSAGLADQIARWVTGFTGDAFSTRKTPAPRHWRGGGGPDGNGGGGSFHDELYDRDSDDMRFVSGASDLAGEPPLPPLPRSASDLACEALERRNDLLLAGALREAKQSVEEEERARVATCTAEVERALQREDALIRVQSLARGRRARRYAAQLRVERPPQPKSAVPAAPTAKQAAAAAAEAAQAALLEEHRAAEEARMAAVAAARAEQRRKEEEELARAQEEDAGLARILAAEAEAVAAAAAAKAEEERIAAEEARAQAQAEAEAKAEAAAQAQALREAQAAAQRESERIATALSSSRNPFALDVSAAVQLADLAPGLFALNPKSPHSEMRERLAEGQCDRCTDRRASLWCATCALKLCDDLTGAGCDSDVHLAADMGTHRRVAWPVQGQASWGEAAEPDGDESASARKSHSFSYAEALTGSTGTGNGAAALHKHSFSHPSCMPTPPPAPAPAPAAVSAAAVSASTKCDECRKWQASVWCSGCKKKLCDDLTGNDCDGTLHLRSDNKQHRRVRWDPIRSPARSRPNTAAAMDATGPPDQTEGAASARPQSGSVNGLGHVLEHAAVPSAVSAPVQGEQPEQEQRAPTADANATISVASAPSAPVVPPSAVSALPSLCDYCESGTRSFSCAQCSMALCGPCETELHAVRDKASHVRVPVQQSQLLDPLQSSAASEQLVALPAAVSSPAPSLCVWCDSAVPSLYCASCSLFLCAACEGEVHAAPDKRSHQRRPLDQAASETVGAPLPQEDSTVSDVATTKPSDEPAHASGLTAAERAVLDARASIYGALTSAPVDALFPSHSSSSVSPVLSGRDLSDIVLAGGSVAEALRLLRSLAAMEPRPVLNSFSQLPDAIWAAWNAEHDAARAARQAQIQAARDGVDDGASPPPSPSITRVRPPPSQLVLHPDGSSGAQQSSSRADSESGPDGLLVAPPPSSRLKVMLPPSPTPPDAEVAVVRHSEEALIAAEWAAYEKSQAEQAEQRRAAHQQAQREARDAAEQQRRKREMYVLYGDDAPSLPAQQTSADTASAVPSPAHSRAASTGPAPTPAAAPASDQAPFQPRPSYQQSLLSPVRRTGAAPSSGHAPVSDSPSSSSTPSSSFPRSVATELDGGSWQLSYPILLATPHVSPSPALVRSGALPFDPLVDLVAFRRRTFTRREALDVITVQSAWRRRRAVRRVRRMRQGE